MMTTNPQLKNHMTREVMHVILPTNDGDTMIRFALSGQDPFSVFRYVVGNYTKAVTYHDRVCIQNVSSAAPSFKTCFSFATEAIQTLVLQFVREVHSLSNPAKHISSNQFTRLIIDNSDNPSFTSRSIFCSKSDPVLKLYYISDSFLDDLISGTVSLANLQKLEFGFTSKQIVKLMSTPSSFPLPEDVTLSIDDEKDALSDLVCLKTFPTVRHLDVHILIYQMISALLHQISTFIKCFTGLETAKIGLFRNHYLADNRFAEIDTFHEWLRDTNFSVPVEVNFCEYVQIFPVANFESICEQLKSFGYKGSKLGFIRQFVIAKMYGNVKMVHIVRVT